MFHMSGIHCIWVFVVSCTSTSICYDISIMLSVSQGRNLPAKFDLQTFCSSISSASYMTNNKLWHICVGIQYALISYCMAPQCFPSFRRQPSLPTAPSSHTLYHLYLTATSRNSICRTISERAPRCSSRGYLRLFPSLHPSSVPRSPASSYAFV